MIRTFLLAISAAALILLGVVPLVTGVTRLEGGDFTPASGFTDAPGFFSAGQ
jgi:hypothetical protein